MFIFVETVLFQGFNSFNPDIHIRYGESIYYKKNKCYPLILTMIISSVESKISAAFGILE